MHVGVFLEEMRAGTDAAAAFRETLAMADAVETLGLDGVWLGELHGLPDRSVISAPLVVAAAIAARTRRIRVGTAVHVLPLRNPLRIAEEVATLDHLSEGRFELGVGRSSSPRVYEVFGVAYGESDARLLEALDLMREAWKGKRFSFRGAHYRVDEAIATPMPRQEPHPPIRIAAQSPESFPRAAAMGLPIFVGLRGMDVAELAPRIATYREAWRAAGHATPASVYLRIPFYAAEDDATAVEEPREGTVRYFQRQAELAQRAVRSGVTARAAEAERLAALTYDHMLRERVVFGAAGTLVRHLRRLRDDLRLDGVVAEPNPGGLLPPERVMRSLEILARDVAPALG